MRISTIFGMNFAFEALPPFHVIQSTAENPRIEERFADEMHHVIGDFGFNKKGRLKLKKINGDAKKVTNKINNLFECELVSPNEIITCVKDNRVGQSPPRRGKPPIIPVDVFKRICWLVDMAC